MRATTLLITLTALLAPVGFAQDLEPNLERAADRVTGAIALELPGREPVPTGLALHARRGTPTAVVGAVAAALTDAGFEVVLGRDARQDGLLHLDLEVERVSSYHQLVLETRDETPTRFTCSYGDATWVDVEVPGLLVTEGPFRADPGEALEAARSLAWRRVLRRAGLNSQRDPGLAHIDRFPTRVFVAGSTSGGQRVHRAYVGLDVNRRQLDHLTRLVVDREEEKAREPIWRAAMSAGLLFLLGVGYVLFDLKTRGYATGALRVVFGILLLVGLLACWRVPL